MGVLKSGCFCICFFVITVSVRRTAAEEGVELHVPTSLGVIKFGDPLFLPVTIVNRTDDAAIVPDLFDMHPYSPIDIRSNVPESVPFTSVGNRGLPPSTRSLPAKSILRSVFALNVWHPREARRMIGGPASTVTISSYRFDRNGRVAGPIIASDSGSFEIDGSSVKNPSIYLNLAKEMVAATAVEDADRTGHRFDDCPQLLEFYGISTFGDTWFTAWPTWKAKTIRDLWISEPYGVRLSQKPEYLAIREQIVEGTALFRAMRCAEIREFIEFGEEPLEERLAKGLKDFREVLSEARPAEYEFHVLSLRHVPANASGPDVRAKYREAFREAFPEVLAGMTDEGFLPVIPLPY